MQVYLGLPGGISGKEPAANAGEERDARFNPWVEKFPWRRKWQPTPVFLPGKSPGQKKLAGYSLWYHKELDTTEATQHTQLGNLHTHTHTHTHIWISISQRLINSHYIKKTI